MFQFAAPLNELAGVVRRFGDGELGVRVKLDRRDSIGDLAQAFNQMAERTQTLLQAERQLLQDISHELRSPLARLSVAAELTRDADERDSAVTQIHKEVDRLTELLEGLIQITRVEADPRVHKLGPVSVTDLVREVIDDCAIEANARGCHLDMRGWTKVTVEADKELLRRAVENLLRNAIRYSPAGKSIEIHVSGSASNASISVRDYGPGVPASALSHIFDPFFRVDHSRDMATGGIGLGLSITQRAIHLHHGQIRAENADPGLRVCMELPLKA
jgi:two-component system sensor histidine kinase CpxA